MQRASLLIQLGSINTQFYKIKQLNIAQKFKRLNSSSSTNPFIEREKRELCDAVNIESALFNSQRHEAAQQQQQQQHYQQQQQQQQHRCQPNRPTSQKYGGRVRPLILKPRAQPKPPKVVTNDTVLNLDYTRIGTNNSILNKMLTEARSRKRGTPGQLIIEGRRLILNALQCGLELDALIFSKKHEIVALKQCVTEHALCAAKKPIDKCKICKIAQHDLKIWSTLTTPPGLLALFKMPTLECIKSAQRSCTDVLLPITVVCDNIADPCSLGGVIRTCAALPCAQIVTLKGCADPWDSSALRGGCGAQFRIPIRDYVEWEQLAACLPIDLIDVCSVFIAENDKRRIGNLAENATEYAKITKIGLHNVIIVGGGGGGGDDAEQGVSKEAYKFMEAVGERGAVLYVPTPKGTAPLNAPANFALILFELRKRLNQRAENV